MEKLYYTLPSNITAEANKKMNNDTVKRLWNSFCITKSKLCISCTNNYIFRIGNVEIPEPEAGSEYAITVSGDGIAVAADSYGGLMRGFFSLIMKIEYTGDEVRIAHMTERSNYRLKNRMIHICVFPENSLLFIKKLIRLSALCQYTHIVIEFWGMLKYDCLKELSWDNAFTKKQAKELITECRELGIEPIPMFNQLGHASASRGGYGKHVVLDRNPMLEYYFTPDGWAWNIKSEKTFKLLKAVRSELYELFGDTEFIHIGCDEAHYISKNDELRSCLPEYISRLTKEIEKEGHSPMLWMDMLLEGKKFKGCYSVGKADEVEKIRASAAGSSVFVDWQYDCKEVPIPSLLSLKDSGHRCMGAPWFDERNYIAHIETVEKNSMYGIMLTTWDTLKEQLPSIIDCSEKFGASGFYWSKSSNKHEKTAVLLRRLSFEGNSYEESGWREKQIEV